MNSHPSPREDNIRQYIKTLQRRDAERMKEQFADKGRDTLLDGYNKEQFEQVCESLWAHGDTSPECHFRTLVDFLLSHYMLARGSDRRAAEISDLFTFEFPHEGPTRCMPVIFTSRAGKENQHGRLETAGGRVLGVTASGGDLESAITAAYEAVSHIHFDGMHYRRDIGQKGLRRMRA